MKPQNTQRPLRVGLISLGCAKNLVDAEIMLGSLLKGGVEITNDAAQADAVIVNTCSFIDAAQEESVDTILESAEVRQANNRGQALIVSGCLPQRFRDDLPKLLPEVDAFMGIDQVAQVNEIVRQAMVNRAGKLSTPSNRKATLEKTGVAAKIAALDKSRPGTHDHEESLRGTRNFGRTKSLVTPAAPPVLNVTPRPKFIPDYATPRFRLTPKHFAYVKIAEGCNHPCTFCIIPRMRGSHRSRTQADVVAEARQLIAEGVMELNLISQDSTYYGLDLRANHSRNIASPDKFNAAAKSLPTDATTLQHVALGEFQRRLQLCVLAVAHAGLGTEDLPVGFEDPSHRPKLPQQLSRQIQRGTAGCSGSQKNRQQFRIGKTLRTLRQKLFPWPLARRPVTDCHTRLPCLSAETSTS
jgi:ribosomal protein S12 methylthiotransferase